MQPGYPVVYAACWIHLPGRVHIPRQVPAAGPHRSICGHAGLSTSCFEVKFLEKYGGCDPVDDCHYPSLEGGIVHG